MQIVYTANHPAEAHMMSHMLERDDIMTHIEETFLSAAAGELPATNLTKIMVKDDDVRQAREIIEKWEKTIPKEEEELSASNTHPSNLRENLIYFLLGCLATWCVMEYMT